MNQNSLTRKKKKSYWIQCTNGPYTDYVISTHTHITHIHLAPLCILVDADGVKRIIRYIGNGDEFWQTTEKNKQMKTQAITHAHKRQRKKKESGRERERDRESAREWGLLHVYFFFAGVGGGSFTPLCVRPFFGAFGLQRIIIECFSLQLIKIRDIYIYNISVEYVRCPNITPQRKILQTCEFFFSNVEAPECFSNWKFMWSAS